MKYLLLFLFSCSNLILLAQSDFDCKHINTGIRVGSDIGILVLKKDNQSANTRIGFGYSIVVDFLEYKPNNKFGFNFGVGFTNRNYRQIIEGFYFVGIKESVTIKEKLRIQNIDIPLTLKYYLPKKNDEYQVYFLAGGSLYFNLFDRSKQEVFFENSTWEFNNRSEIQQITYATNLGMGIQFSINHKIQYYLESTLQINHNQIDFEYGNSSNFLINLGISMGLKF